MTAVELQRVAEDEFEEQLWSALDARIGALTPVYTPLVEGRMTGPALAHWAGQLYLENIPIPRMLGGILAQCDDPDAQVYIIENLWDETGEGVPERNHTRILGRFVAACGVDPDEIGRLQPDPATRSIMDFYLAMPQWPWIEALGAFALGIEGTFLSRPGSDMPASAVLMAQILREKYGFEEHDLEFFMLHSTLDVEHTRKSLEILRRHAATDEQRARVQARISETIDQVTRWASAIMDRSLSL